MSMSTVFQKGHCNQCTLNISALKTCCHFYNNGILREKHHHMIFQTSLWFLPPDCICAGIKWGNITSIWSCEYVLMQLSRIHLRPQREKQNKTKNSLFAHKLVDKQNGECNCGSQIKTTCKRVYKNLALNIVRFCFHTFFEKQITVACRYKCIGIMCKEPKPICAGLSVQSQQLSIKFQNTCNYTKHENLREKKKKKFSN